MLCYTDNLNQKLIYKVRDGFNEMLLIKHDSEQHVGKSQRKECQFEEMYYRNT